jgi:hypothetical protein
MQIQSNSNKDKRDIWIPPKPQAQLPFGLSPPPEPVKPSDFKKTTYADHEQELLREGFMQLAMNIGICSFVAFKFQIYFSLLMQSVMMPLNVWDNILFKKYILGVKKNADGTSLYGEHFREPTEKSIAAAEKVANALASGKDKASEETDSSDEKKETKTTTTAPSSSSSKKEKFVPSKAQSSIDPHELRVELLSSDDEGESTKPKKNTKKDYSEEEEEEEVTKKASKSTAAAPSSSSSNNMQDLD